MRAAPAVSAPLDAGRPEQVLIALLYALTGAALAGWVAAHGAATALPGWAAVGALAGGVVGSAVAMRLLPGDVGQLTWDGSAWSVRQVDRRTAFTRDTVVQPSVALDLGCWLLLHVRAASQRRQWLVLRERHAGASWHLLRVALRAHAGPAPKGQAATAPAGDRP